MVLKIDFNSDEVIYIRLRDQIIMGIVMDMIREGDSLPSVRQIADYIDINMYTVNKAYTVLKQEGLVKLDRRRGVVVSPDINKIQVIGEMRRNLDAMLAWGICKSMTRQEVHQLVDEIPDKYARGCTEGEDEVEENWDGDSAPLVTNGGFVCYVKDVRSGKPISDTQRS